MHSPSVDKSSPPTHYQSPHQILSELQSELRSMQQALFEQRAAEILFKKLDAAQARVQQLKDALGPEEPVLTGEWIGVDLDHTLAHFDVYQGPEHIGAPVPAMAARVRKWLAEGRDIRIFTARADGGRVGMAMGLPEAFKFKDRANITRIIQDWTERHFGKRLPVTCTKDYMCVAIYDDRAVRILQNTGLTCCSHPEELLAIDQAKPKVEGG